MNQKSVKIKIEDFKDNRFYIDESDLTSPEMQKSMQEYHEELKYHEEVEYLRAIASAHVPILENKKL